MIRVTSQIMQRTATSRIFQITEELFRAQLEISSGKRIQRPSDDPAGIRDSLVIRTSLSQASQFIRNINNNGLFMQSADAALDTLGQSLTRARELALGALNGTATAETRGFAAIEVSQLVQQALEAANTKAKNHFIFSGTRVRVRPFEEGPSAAVYHGNTESFRIEIDSDSRLAIGLPGSEVLGVDLNPALGAATLLDDLNGGAGVAAGQFQITDRSGASALIAVAPGMTVGDVIAAINGAGLSVTAGLSSAGNGIALTDASPVILGPLIVSEVGGGSAAAELGLLGLRDGNLEGVDLDPVLTAQTPIASLEGGQGLTLGEIQVTNGAASAVLDLSGAVTVGDVLAIINGAGLNVTAGINSAGNALTLDSNDLASAAVATTVGHDDTAARLGLGGGRNVITTLIQLKLALERNDTPGIIASLDNLEGALASVNQSRAIIGANLRLAENTEFTHNQDIVDQTAQLSRIEDADLVKSASDLASMEQALQATLGVTARILQPTLLDFLR